MFDRDIFGIHRSVCFNKLHKLLGWQLPIDRWILKLPCMSCRVLLRDNWPECSDGILRNWIVSGLDWLNRLFGLSRGVVLRDDRFGSSHGYLRDWKVFDFFIDCLLKLSYRNIPGLHGLYRMYTMSCRLVLRDHRFDNCDGILCSW